MEYIEPELTVAVLDFCKPIESRLLLQSIKQHVKLLHKVLFCDNGSGEDYVLEFLREGLVDQLIVNRESWGLGVGTRDLINAVTTPWFAYVQNDQLFAADFTQSHFDLIKHVLQDGKIASVSLASYPCGEYAYSERAHVMKTSLYKSLEPLPLGGAGKLHEMEWREGAIQKIYKERDWYNWAIPACQVVQDNGVYAVRDMGNGGYWMHRTDTKELVCIIPPAIKNPAYPKINDEEFALAAAGNWPDWRIPEVEAKDSFHCWDHTMLVQMKDDYVKDLRRRIKEKNRNV